MRERERLSWTYRSTRGQEAAGGILLGKSSVLICLPVKSFSALFIVLFAFPPTTLIPYCLPRHYRGSANSPANIWWYMYTYDWGRLATIDLKRRNYKGFFFVAQLMLRQVIQSQ